MTDLRDQPPTVDRLAELAAELVVRVRDEGPGDNARWLTRKLPNPGDWFRLAFVLAAAVPDGQPWTELTAWTRPLSAVPAPAPPPAVSRPRIKRAPLKPCGTLAAINRHRYHREPLCPACREASRTYERERARRRRDTSTPDRRTA